MTSKQTAVFFELLAATAVQEIEKNGEFTIPGLGKLVKVQRAARLGRDPQTGESIKIKAKTTVKFRVAKAAKDAIAPVIYHQPLASHMVLCSSKGPYGFCDATQHNV